MLAASAEGIVAVDAQGVIRLCNRAAADLLGRQEEELIGSPFGVPVSGEHGAELEVLLPGGGERVTEMRATITVEGGRLHVIALHDLTARARLERELKADRERQGIMVGVAAHELHNPLTAIGMLAHVLRERHATMSAAERTEFIDHIIDRTAHLKTVIRKLLTAARIDVAGVQAARVRVPAREAIAEQLSVLGDGPGDVTVTCGPGVEVLADRAEFAIMLANYLENAVRYGGPPVGIRVDEVGGWAEIRVSDHGPGVPAEFVPRLFERFAQAQAPGRRAEGTGLGLWIVAAFARANDGEAWYEPRAEGGACFCLRLPLAPPHSA